MTTSLENVTGITRARKLTRDILWNLGGQILPLPIVVVVIPILIYRLGTEKFGVLTLAWGLMAYFGPFDLGIGRALTKLIADRIGGGRARDIPSLAWTGIGMMFLLGILAGLILGLICPWLVYDILKVPTPLQHQTLISFYLLALMLPLNVSLGGFRGILSAIGRFDLLNLARIPASMFLTVGPAIVSLFSTNLIPVTAILIIGRLIFWLIHCQLCFLSVPDLWAGATFDCSEIRPLLSFGGWITVTSIAAPTMEYLDRFLIGALISLSAVAYYVTPYELIIKVLIIPGAVTSVLFPMFAKDLADQGKHTLVLHNIGLKGVVLVMFPAILVIVTFAPELLALWLGHRFAQQSTTVLQWLAVGAFVMSTAYLPFTLIQAAHRPDLTATVHLIEMPVYLLVLWWLLREHGVTGAAVAWTFRVTMDLALLLIVARRLFGTVASASDRIGIALLIALAVFTCAALLPQHILTKLWFLLCMLVLYVPAGWCLILTADDRQKIWDYARYTKGSLLPL